MHIEHIAMYVNDLEKRKDGQFPFQRVGSCTPSLGMKQPEGTLEKKAEAVKDSAFF